MFTDDLEGFTFPTRSLSPTAAPRYLASPGLMAPRRMRPGQSGTFPGTAISSDYRRTFPARVYGSGVGLPELIPSMASAGRQLRL